MVKVAIWKAFEPTVQVRESRSAKQPESAAGSGARDQLSPSFLE
jgi:hypothetical protein